MKKTRKEIIRHKSNKTCTGLYTENHKMLMKEINKDLDKWKDILCSWIRSLNIVKKNVNSPQSGFNIISESTFRMLFYIQTDLQI